MPLYEYGCPSCGTTTDVRHGFDETPELQCEACGSALTRQFSAPPIVFKGSGFYVTDSRKPSSSSDAKPSTKSETPASPETKSVPKTEAKSEPAPAKAESKSEAAA